MQKQDKRSEFEVDKPGHADQKDGHHVVGEHHKVVLVSGFDPPEHTMKTTFLKEGETYERRQCMPTPLFA